MAAEKERAVEEPLRVGTYNIRAGVAQSDFETAVTTFQPMADVIGLQEIGSTDRGTWLASDSRWGHFRPPALGQNPIIWRRSLFDFAGAEGFRIATERDLHGEHSGDGDKGDSWATIVRLVQRTTGQELSFINVHLVRGAVKGGKPAPGRPHLFRLYRDQVRGTVKAIQQEKQRSDEVFVLGDLNVGFEADLKRKHKALPFKKFRRVGLRSMWQGSPLLKKSYGTHNDALIDQVYNAGNSSAEAIIRSIKQSDHWPAVATYQLPVDPTYVPVVGSVGFHPGDLEQSERERDGKTRDPDLEFRLVGDLRHGAAALEFAGSAVRGTTYGGGDYLVDDSELYDNDLDSASIYIDFQGDYADEPDEWFTMTLVALDGTTTVIPAQAVARGTLRNDD